MVKSKTFALDVIRACRILREAKCEGALIRQFLRSGTSIGANIHEAFYAHGKADFIAKLHIALKEYSETEYWLELLIESGYFGDKSMLDKCVELKRILIASINTAKKKVPDIFPCANLRPPPKKTKTKKINASRRNHEKISQNSRQIVSNHPEYRFRRFCADVHDIIHHQSEMAFSCPRGSHGSYLRSHTSSLVLQ